MRWSLYSQIFFQNPTITLKIFLKINVEELLQKIAKFGMFFPRAIHPCTKYIYSI